MEQRLPTFEDILAARERLAPWAVRTPLLEHPTLNAATGARVLLKAETLQRVGAFKFRGAYNRIAQVDPAMFPGGVVACSSGNHAQGVAAAATLCGLKSLIVMPEDAPRLKLARTKAFGGEVMMYDRVREDRDAVARAVCAEREAAYVHPFDDPDVIAGQGTVGLEMMEQASMMGVVPDAVLVPCSGGGLVSGIAIAVKRICLETEVYTVEPTGFDDFGRSLRSGKREKNEHLAGSICDALLVPTPGEITFEVAKQTVTAGLAVTDEEVRSGLRFAFDELKLVAEPGGAAALAALLAGKLPVADRTVACVLSGANIDPTLYAEIITSRPSDSKP
jgi:threonine dehydratase